MPNPPGRSRAKPFPAALIRFLPALAALGVVAAASWFRLTRLTANPLWLDEGYSAYAAGKGFGFLWHVTPHYETHPPFYYSLLRLWTLAFGDSTEALRALGALCGLLTLPFVALAAREAARWLGVSRWPPMLAALMLAALSPILIQMARDVRPYPVLILVYACATFALLRTGRIAEAERRLPVAPFLLYVACLALMLWLHNLGPLYAEALGLAALAVVARRGLTTRDWALFVGGYAFAALAWLPALLILLDQAPTWIASTWLHFRFDGLQWRLAGLWVAPGEDAAWAALVLLALALAVLLPRRAGARIAAALLLLAIVPAALSILISWAKTPIFIPRTMSALAVPALLLLAIGATCGRGLARVAGAAALLVLCWQMVAVDRRVAAAAPMEDWYGTVRWLAARYRPGDQVWSYPNEGALPLDYAARDLGARIEDVPLPTPVPSLGQGPGSWNPTGSRGVVSLSRARLRAIVRAPGVAAIPTIWLHRLGPEAYDKGDVLRDELESAGRVEVAHWEAEPIDIIGLSLDPSLAGRGRGWVRASAREKDSVPPGGSHPSPLP